MALLTRALGLCLMSSHNPPTPSVKGIYVLDVRVLAHLHAYVIIMARTHMSPHDQRMSADIHMLSCS